MLFAKLTLAGEQASLKAGDRRGYLLLVEQAPHIVQAVLFEVLVELAQPDFNGRALSGRVVLDVAREFGIERTDLTDGRNHDTCAARLSRSHVPAGHASTSRRISCEHSSTFTRHCLSESRSRIVTVPSVSD